VGGLFHSTTGVGNRPGVRRRQRGSRLHLSWSRHMCPGAMRFGCPPPRAPHAPHAPNSLHHTTCGVLHQNHLRHTSVACSKAPGPSGEWMSTAAPASPCCPWSRGRTHGLCQTSLTLPGTTMTNRPRPVARDYGLYIFPICKLGF
jgi:hypothetical protein